jgi:DNA-dependent metalloprotease WSS1
VRAGQPSLSTGAQTATRRKAGSRVTSKTAFEAAGGGSVLDERVAKGAKGSGFGKQAGRCVGFVIPTFVLGFEF